MPCWLGVSDTRAAVIEGLPDLRVIARLGVGFDRVDLKSASERGVVVTITPNSNHEAVAEHALALIMGLAKTIVAGDKADASRRVARGAAEASPREHAGDRGAGTNRTKPGSARRCHADAGHSDGAIPRPRVR